MALYSLFYWSTSRLGQPPTADLWINPNIDNGQAGLGAANASISLNSTAPITTFDHIRLFAGGFSTGNGSADMLVDEIRIGGNFSDVAPVPEPGSVALLGIGLAVLVMVCRRRGRDATV